MKKLICFVLFVSLSGCNVISLTEENDIFGISKNHDYMYSQGLQVSGYTREKDTPEVIKKVVAYIPSLNPLGPVEANKYTYAAGQQMYTPDDLRTTEIQPDKNPYCGLLYFGIGKEEITEESRKWASLMVGTTGSHSLAGQTQAWFHGSVGMQRPMGWKYQVDNEAVFMHQSGLEVRDLQVKYKEWKWEQTSGYNLNLGTWNTSAEMFLDWRTGINYELFSKANQHDWAFHFYNKPYMKAVVRDMTLDGNTFHDSQVTVDKEPFVYGNRFGMKFELYGYELDLFAMTQSRIWETQERPWHTWGGWTIQKVFQLD